MNKKKLILLILGLIIIAGLVMVIAVERNKTPLAIDNNDQPFVPQTEDLGDKVSNVEEAIPDDPFQRQMPKDVKVPEANEVIADNMKEIIAVPKVVAEAAPGVTAKFRSFDIRGEGGKFIPSQIIANTGDTVHVNFTAIDQAYDIVFSSYNMKQTAQPGQTKILEFQALQTGNFIYYCDLCGGPESKTKGNFIIVE